MVSSIHPLAFPIPYLREDEMRGSGVAGAMITGSPREASPNVQNLVIFFTVKNTCLSSSFYPAIQLQPLEGAQIKILGIKKEKLFF